ncbi:serine O-acetyltransferase, partial [Acinetobacter baumannii]
KDKDEERRRDYAQSIGFAPDATAADQSAPILEGMRVLLDRIQHNETRMNNLCQRLSELDPTFKKESQDEQPFSDEELKILEEVRRECGAQNKTSKT